MSLNTRLGKGTDTSIESSSAVCAICDDPASSKLLHQPIYQSISCCLDGSPRMWLACQANPLPREMPRRNGKRRRRLIVCLLFTCATRATVRSVLLDLPPKLPTLRTLSLALYVAVLFCVESRHSSLIGVLKENRVLQAPPPSTCYGTTDNHQLPTALAFSDALNSHPYQLRLLPCHGYSAPRQKEQAA